MRLMLVVCVNAPDVPVTITGIGPPMVAEPLAVSVSTVVVVVLSGRNVAVTPLGKPEAAKLTVPVNPLVGVTVIVLGPLLPCTTLRAPGDADNVKFGGAVTVRLTVVVCVREPDVPVTVTGIGPPMVAELLADRVRMLVVVVVVGRNVAVTPLGKPEAARLTLPVKPLVGVKVIVLGPLLPWTTLRALGAADSVKFGGAVTVRLTVVVCVREPDVPVTVTGIGPPIIAEVLAASANVLVVVVLEGTNVAVTPLGKPEAAKLTVPVNPLAGVTIIVLVPLLPCTTLTALGDADNVKFAVVVAVTISLNVAGVSPVVDAVIITVPLALGVM